MSKDEGKKKTKSAIEQASIINEVIKRENRYHSINKVFTLNPKKCKNKLNFIVYIIAEKPVSLKINLTDNVSRANAIPIGI